MKKIAITLGSVCLILTMAIFIQIKTVESITEEEASFCYRIYNSRDNKPD